MEKATGPSIVGNKKFEITTALDATCEFRYHNIIIKSLKSGHSNFVLEDSDTNLIIGQMCIHN